MISNLSGKGVKQLSVIHPSASLEQLKGGTLKFFDGKALYCYFQAGFNL